jgi:hypothetical protein
MAISGIVWQVFREAIRVERTGAELVAENLRAIAHASMDQLGDATLRPDGRDEGVEFDGER